MSLQQLLGKNYKWWYIVWFNFRSMTQYRFNTLMWTINGFVLLCITIAVWTVNIINGSDLDIAYLITYILIGNWYSAAVNNWAGEEISQWILNGKITPKLLYPTPFLLRYLAEFVGKAFFGEFLIKSLTYFILIPVFISYLNLSSSIFSYLLLALFLPISFVISLLFSSIMGMISFWFIDFGAIGSTAAAVEDFLKGTYIPLYIILGISSWFSFLNFLPFAFLLHHPIQIYLGMYSISEQIGAFIGGLVWCVTLFILAQFMLTQGLKRNESVGL